MARPVPLFLRVVAIGGAVLLMAVVTLVVAPQIREARERPEFPPVGPLTPPTTPIAAEARPYRLRPADVAVAPDVEPRAGAQPRTLAVHRSLRAYPGAPPRIPHGLTEEEFRYGLCNSCHARGGFAPRFGAYTPVTPHPELTSCLQCHAPDAMTVGMGIPALTQDVICGQCHVDPDNPPPSLVALDWTPQGWPQLGGRAMEGGPLWIPHGLQLREDCLACHGGPSAIPAIRTTHPERVDCRSCHVPAPGVAQEVFERPLDGRGGEG